MTRLLAAAFFSCLLCLTACGHHNYSVKGPERIPTKLEIDKPASGDLIVGMPISLPNSDYTLLPVTLEHLKEWFEPDPYYGYSASDHADYDYVPASYRMLAYSRYSMEQVSWSTHWHNVIIHNQKDDKTRILLDRPAVISRYEIVGQKPRKEGESFRLDCLLFSISDRDTNQDGLIDKNDAVVVYACDIDGSNLRRITPEGSMLLRVNYVPSQKLMYLVVLEDTNQDGKYTTHDKQALLRYRISDPGLGQPIVDPKQIDLARKFLNAQ